MNGQWPKVIFEQQNIIERARQCIVNRLRLDVQSLFLWKIAFVK